MRKNCFIIKISKLYNKYLFLSKNTQEVIFFIFDVLFINHVILQSYKSNKRCIMKEEFDKELIKTFNNTKNVECLNEIFIQHHGKIFGFCLSICKDRDKAHGLIQDMYIDMHDKRKNFTINADGFFGWIYNRVKWRYFDLLRNDKKKREKLEKYKILVHSAKYNRFIIGDGENSKTYEDKIIDVVIKNIENLEGNQKICINDFYLEEMTYKEIAEIHYLTLDQVRSAIQNGRRKLKILSKDDIDRQFINDVE